VGMKLALHDYYPFGVEQTSLLQEALEHGFDRPEPLKFTSHERDFTSGTITENTNYLDYMHARYYTSNYGRFLSPDRVLGSPRSPQSWNRYAYGVNNPVNLTDPAGLSPCPPRECPQPTPGYFDFLYESWLWSQQGPSAARRLLDARAARQFYAGLIHDETNAYRERVSDWEEVWAKCEMGDCSGVEVKGGTVMIGGVGALPKLTGMTKHALNQAISRDGTGVAAKAIADTLKNPVAVRAMSDGTTRIVGRHATVVVNELFRMVTVWARSSAGWRILP
jgi:RHS repeat-associated protein